MKDFVLSLHAQEMLKKRKISEDWLQQTIECPEKEITEVSDAKHYFKSIMEQEGRVLHVVLNPLVSPRKVITVFFDRRGRKNL